MISDDVNKKKEPRLKDLGTLEKHFSRARAAITALSNAFKTVEDPRKSKHAGSKNHNQKRNKVRAKMAAKSRRINRLHEKRKKH